MNRRQFKCFNLACLFCLFCTAICGVAKAQVASFTADHQAGCAPLLVHFTNTSTGATSYSWNLGNTNTSTLQDPSASYLSPGTYTVTLTATGSSGSATQTLTITVYSVPQVSFSAPTAVCAGTTVNFANQTTAGVPGAITYSWNFGDGGTSTAQSPAHTYAAAGTYNVSLLATNSQGCDSLLIKAGYIQVLPHPVAAFTVNNSNFCAPPAIAIFTDQSTGNSPFSYTWNYGDNGTGTGSNPTHNYTSDGTYTVSLVTTDVNGCRDTATHASYITVGGPSTSFTAPSGCAGSPVTFVSNTTPVGVTFIWNFGNGTLGTGNIASNTYSAGGTYNVQLIATDGTCNDTVTEPVTILPPPAASFTFTPMEPCGPGTIAFTSTAPAGSTYSWGFGDGTASSTAANPTHAYTTYGIDTVSVTITNGNSCQATITQPVKIYDLYAIASPVGGAGGCLPFNTVFSVRDSTTVPAPLPPAYPYPITTYLWNFGDGTPTSNQASPSHTYTVAGKYTAIVTITTANGCTATDSVHITTGAVPTLVMTATPTHICTDRDVYFSATPTPGAYYTWNYGDGTLPTSVLDDTTTMHQYTIPGVFHPSVIVSFNGCTDTNTVFNTNVTVDSPKARYVALYQCDTFTKITFVNSSLGQNTYTWSFGDGSTSTLAAPSHTFPTLGTYPVQLIAYNAASGCYDTTTTPVTVTVAQPAFTASRTSSCIGTPISFLGSITNGIANLYGWYADGAYIQSSNSDSISHTFYSPGKHTMALVVTDSHGCNDTLTRTDYILIANPVASFSATPAQGCTPLTVQFTDNSSDVAGFSIVSHSWYYGDGGSTPGAPTMASHTYATGNNFTPIETIADNIGCTDTITGSNITVSKPAATFTASTLFPCKNIPITFNNTSRNINTNSWSFGDNGTSFIASPTHTYTQNGTYTVSLAVTDANGCKDTLVRTLYLKVGAPTAAFNLSDSISICSPLIENFTNKSTGAASYQWIFGNNTFSTLTSPSTPYSTPGTYVVELVAIDANGCTDTAKRNLKIYGYAGEMTYTPIVGCSPLTVHFTANITNVPHITWDFSDGNLSPTSSAVTATHTYTSPGAYVPKLIISDSSGCSASSAGADTIKVDGIIGGFTTQPNPVCINDTVYFSDTSKSYFSQVISHQWTFNNSTTSFLASPQYIFTTTNSLPVSLIAINANGCKDSVKGTVAVHGLPTITTTGDTTICLNDSATITAKGGVSYTWAPAATVGCITCATTHVSPTAAEVYTVTGKDAFGCVNTDTVQVTVKTKTTDWPGKGGEICDKQSIVITDSGAQSYNWYPAYGLSSSTVADPAASPEYNVTYTVVAHEGSCTPDTSYITVIVHPLPTAKATAGNTEIIAGSTTDLLASGTGVTTFFWEPADLVDCDSCSHAVAKLTQTTTFTVVGITDYGCEDSGKVTVEVLCDKSQLFIPNTFTPNGDGQNDVFYPRGVGLKVINSFRVYNRWGEKIFERTGIQLNDAGNAWDGTIQGSKPLPDVYVYVVDGVCDNGSPISWKGDVTLVR